MAATFGERVQSVEKALDKQTEMMDLLYKQVQNAFEVQRSFLDVLVETLKDKIPDFQAALEESAKKLEKAKQKAKLEQQKAQVEHLVKGGLLKLVDEVVKDSLVVAEVTSATGELLADWAVFSMDSESTPDWVKQGFMGKKPGDLIKTPQDESVLVLEVYVPSTPPPVEVDSKPPEASTQEK
jgi:hypothetical protein